MKPLALVTRPEPDGLSFAAELHAAGYRTLLMPVMDIRSFRADIPGGVQGIILTSRHALPALKGCERLPLYCVGAETAAEAGRLGFRHVALQAGDAKGLAEAIKALRPVFPLLYARGRDVAFDMAEALSQADIGIQERVCYAAAARRALSPPAAAALHGREVNVIPLFSVRSASAFLTLVGKAGLMAALLGAHGVCISGAVAEAVARASWKSLSVSEQPSRASMIRAMDKALEPH